MTRAELTKYIHEHFPCREDYPWEKYPTYATFKHPENGKWFALVADVDYEKLRPRDKATDKRSDREPSGEPGGDCAEALARRTGKVDFVNLKNDPDLIVSLRREPGILPAYHMNKEHWLTVLLDGSTDPELLKALVATSFEMTE